MPTPKTTKPAPRRAAPRFSSLTKAKQRVAIAQDVLTQLDSRKIVAASGAFCHVAAVPDKGGKTSLRSLISRAQAPCKVCALGSILVAQVNVNGDCRIGSLCKWALGCSNDLRYTPTALYPFQEGKPSAFLSTYFSRRQLQLIEVAFERGAGAVSIAHAVDNSLQVYAQVAKQRDCILTRDEARRAIAFHEPSDYNEIRLRAIMTNIIEHKGTFVP